MSNNEEKYEVGQNSEEGAEVAALRAGKKLQESDDEQEEDDHDSGEEEQEELVEVQTPFLKGKKKQSFSLRTKKFIASKTAQSSLGRRAIGHFLGEEGNRFVSTMKAAAKLHAGDARAKELKMLVFKLALKGKLLQDEKLIRKSDVWMMLEPCNNMAIRYYELSKPRPRKPELQVNEDEDEVKPKGKAAEEKKEARGEDEPKDIEPLIADILLVKEMVINSIAPHITEKNLNYLVGVFDFYSDRAFLNKLLNGNDPLMIEYRHTSFSCVRKIMAPILEDRNFNDKMQELCKVEGCEAFAVVADATFRGSSKCVEHHQESYQTLLKNPTVDHFLTGDGESYWPFQIEVKKEVERFARKLYVTLRRYRISITPGVRPVFAAEVWKKYLKSGSSHHVNCKMEQELTVIESRLASKDPELFSKIEQSLYTRIDDYFRKHFVGSAIYKEYLAVYKLPPYLQQELKELLKAKKNPKKIEEE